MKYTYTSLIILLIGILLGCTENKEIKLLGNNDSTDVVIEIPNRTIEKSFLNYNRKISLWTLNNEPYSGYAVSYYSDSTLKEKIGILNGKTESQSLTFYEDGHLKQLSNYHNGKLHGEKKLWTSNTSHVLLSHLNYQFGKPHGEQKTWYPTGELHKILNMNMGKEDNIQQAFRKNGALYANYEAKEGRIFGLKKAALCFGLEDENIQYEE
jgi:antitoxin component YwqK of YwqJK toxin-antitoxin module